MRKQLLLICALSIMCGCSKHPTTIMTGSEKQENIDSQSSVSTVTNDFDKKEGLKSIAINLSTLDESLLTIEGNRCLGELSETIHTEMHGSCKTDNNTFFFVSSGESNKRLSLLVNDLSEGDETVKLSYSWAETGDEQSNKKISTSLWKVEGNKNVEFILLENNSYINEVDSETIE